MGTACKQSQHWGLIALCGRYSWLSIWLPLEWTTIQKWRAHLSVIQILRHSGRESLGPGKRIHDSNPRRQRKPDLWVQGQPGIEQVPNPGMVVHTFNLGHTFCWRPTEEQWKVFAPLHMLALSCQHICWNPLLQDSSLYRRPAKTPILKGLGNY